ncbi:uncharacterized protein PHACADRAFT_255931 [Phanerochaete carnosa HHB-10118-sp]|uniref:RlpA-like protein double-psi beta-barrel domain-containing protein n=1 Tax=Phanerochaete carnosa (strain HHB-10118-sp) TaxID=650164 RepID=K5WY06_PHACS|nr:uncharacterized protein PHACADRAFT_255931 [Phanerochaete carnosa HHB-10118-sp]EKM55357.1 hypothetical protein PHACADRAFT_255931 [Phanerochaete carnosa HHB-10118-sp]
MFKFIALTLTAVAAVRGIVIPATHISRRDLATYDSSALESYSTYSTRYQELGCSSQHDTQFFTDCCHPLLKDQTLADRPSYCTPTNSSTSATPTASADPENTTTSIPLSVNAAAPPPGSGSSPTTPAASAPSPTNTGTATWFTQDNNPGACGIVHQDSDEVVALASAIYDGKYCGMKVLLTNLATGATTQATVADECPGCRSMYSLDLSQGAFNALSGNNLGMGVFPLGWSFVPNQS